MSRLVKLRPRALLVVIVLISTALLASLVWQLVRDPGPPHRVSELPVALSGISGISWDGERLWITVENANAIYAVNPASGEIERELGFPVARTGGSAWDGEGLWQLAYEEGRIYKVDIETGEILETIPAPGDGMCSGMTYDGSHLWLANWIERKIYEIGPEQGGRVINVYDSDFETTGLAWDGAYLWNGVLVGTEEHDEVTPYTGFAQQRDPAANETLRAVPIQGVFGGSTDWVPGERRAHRMWWYDGYHDRIVEVRLDDGGSSLLVAQVVLAGLLVTLGVWGAKRRARAV